ncbi:heavy metal translocating P-type ATPase [Streptomyces lividans]|uniref:Lead, cadmium, zinc and mercury transporting ATPase n=4 Tax=Streptomyces TaxID=1883 RepID=A0A7U9DYP8_STRLI|nr:MULTISPECIES: heavy metal translocating P-type ATPase [Streptomyces]QSJ07748.1 putative cation-transporting P-type ATPase D [Streptomyces lividans]AIJ12240.1 putative cation-transporting P-type ATPase D [Streptomyces lividans TK24]EOY51512.1 Lead, cadmium, zinc and mercury transporting ATPase [Streptomyces lividans 1326]KKD16732.1 metal ABC transporter ATPase [Streptomyces sp. WM6391]QTD68672.1 putative cation-transporting P-type ATPase D [Streptomyces lividans TK24] [Streptomyces lividans]
MSTTLAPTPVPAPVRRAPRRRTRVLALPEARWALVSLVAFLLALPLDLGGAPAWTYGPLYAVAYASGGWEPALEGLRALREKTLDVDLLMIVAALGAAAIGQVLDGGLLIVIFATSGALEALATARTADSVRGLLDLAPTTATRLREGGEETVPTADLAVGDLVLVRPGERIGADGTVAEGAGEVDQATITGESLPVLKRPGDDVFAGTLNGTGALRVRVGRDPADSVIARIVTLVEEASRTKAPTQLFIEKIEQRYSVGVVVATLAVFGIPLAFGADLTDALLRAMTFMIVASPCAVVLATMPPLLSAIANAGRHGVLVKSAVAMERLGEIDTAALDKTGTLTEGTPEVTAVTPAAGAGVDEDALLALAAAAEHPSEHPLARAIVAAARARGLHIAPADDFTAAPGRGVTAVIDGRTVHVGRAEPTEGTAGAAGAETTVRVTRDGTHLGTLALTDRLRDDAARATTRLTALTGTAPTLLTGDHAAAAARVADATGITDVRAGLLPEDKVGAVRERERAGRKVLFVGDGVNDAPALAAAHAGVAMGRAGSDLALETADAVVVRDELTAVPAVVDLSRRARRLVVQNLAVAGVFITVLVLWDLIGHLPLPLGVAGHEGSTVLVGLNGLRLLRESAWRPE